MLSYEDHEQLHHSSSISLSGICTYLGPETLGSWLFVVPQPQGNSHTASERAEKEDSLNLLTESRPVHQCSAAQRNCLRFGPVQDVGASRGTHLISSAAAIFEPKISTFEICIFSRRRLQNEPKLELSGSWVALDSCSAPCWLFRHSGENSRFLVTLILFVSGLGKCEFIVLILAWISVQDFDRSFAGVENH